MTSYLLGLLWTFRTPYYPFAIATYTILIKTLLNGTIALHRCPRYLFYGYSMSTSLSIGPLNSVPGLISDPNAAFKPLLCNEIIYTEFCSTHFRSTTMQSNIEPRELPINVSSQVSRPPHQYVLYVSTSAVPVSVPCLWRPAVYFSNFWHPAVYFLNLCCLFMEKLNSQRLDVPFIKIPPFCRVILYDLARDIRTLPPTPAVPRIIGFFYFSFACSKVCPLWSYAQASSTTSAPCYFLPNPGRRTATNFPDNFPYTQVSSRITGDTSISCRLPLESWCQDETHNLYPFFQRDIVSCLFTYSCADTPRPRRSTGPFVAIRRSLSTCNLFLVMLSFSSICRSLTQPLI